MFRSTVKRRVRDGVRVLDAYCPGWAEKIDVAILDIHWPEVCILGQLPGGFFGTSTKMGIRNRTVDHGFCATGSADNKALVKEWTRVIQRKRVNWRRGVCRIVLRRWDL